ncbi:hypothetical protein EAO69_29215 [Streptomyces sp. me109]|nr:hypothetical protein EAO69_29215 [Streptomyces sp. me109]
MPARTGKITSGHQPFSLGPAAPGPHLTASQRAAGIARPRGARLAPSAAPALDEEALQAEAGYDPS